MKQTIKKLYHSTKQMIELFLSNKYFSGLYRKNLYLSLYELPLGNYISIVVDGDFKAVNKKRSFVPRPALIRQINELQKQYSEMSDQKTYEGYVTRNQEKDLMRAQIFFYSTALKLIVDFDNMKGVIDFFNENGFFGTKEEIANQVLAEVKAIKSRLDDMELIDKTQQTDNKKEKITRELYSRVILVAKKNGYDINYKSSVADFITAMHLQKEEIKNLENHA